MVVSKENFVFFGEGIGEMYGRVQDLGSRKRLCGCDLEKLRESIWYIETKFHPALCEVPMPNRQHPSMLILPRAFVDVYCLGNALFTENVFKLREVFGEMGWIEDDPIDIYSQVRGGRNISQRRCAEIGNRAAKLYAEIVEQYMGC